MNLTRVECKLISTLLKVLIYQPMNLTRVECKRFNKAFAIAIVKP